MVQVKIPGSKLLWLERTYHAPPKQALETLYTEKGSWTAVAKELGIADTTLISWRYILGITEGAEPDKSTTKLPGRLREIEERYDLPIGQALHKARQELGSWRMVAEELGLGITTVIAYRDPIGAESHVDYS